MLISDFLQEKLQLKLDEQVIALLNTLAGKKLHNVSFYATVEDASQWYQPWMPLYFLPIAKQGFSYIGFDLRPEMVLNGRFPLLKADNDSVLDALLIGVGQSLPDYLYRLFLEWEALLNEEEDPVDEVDEGVALLADILGDSFYETGQHEELYPDEESDFLIELNKADTLDVYKDAQYGERPATETLQEGIEEFPHYLYLYAKLVKELLKQGEEEQAADVYASSLHQYYHTSYYADMAEEYLDTGRDLLKKFPDKFDEQTTQQLSWTDRETRLRDILNLYQNGQLDLSVKWLDDFCYDLRYYPFPPLLAVFREHYKQLNWAWALALVELRASLPQDTPTFKENYSAVWQEIVEPMIQN